MQVTDALAQILSSIPGQMTARRGAHVIEQRRQMDPAGRAESGPRCHRRPASTLRPVFAVFASCRITPGVHLHDTQTDPDGGDTADRGAGAQWGSALEGGAPLTFDELVGQSALGITFQKATAYMLQSSGAKVSGHEAIGGH